MAKITPQNLTKTLQILNAMEPQAARRLRLSLLAEAEGDDERLHQLQEAFFSTAELAENLSREELRQLLHTMEDSQIAELAVLPELAMLLPKGLPKGRLERIDALRGNQKALVPSPAVGMLFRQQLLACVEQGKVDPAVLPDELAPGCRAGFSVQSREAFLLSEQPYFLPFEPIEVQVFSPPLNRNLIRLHFMKDGKKTFTKDHPFKELFLDERGQTTFYHPGFGEEGVYTLYAEEAQSCRLLARLDVLVLRLENGGVAAGVTRMYREIYGSGEVLAVEVQLTAGDSKVDEPVTFVAVCRSCGRMFTAGTGEALGNGLHRLRFRERNHSGAYLLELTTSDDRHIAINLPEVTLQPIARANAGVSIAFTDTPIKHDEALTFTLQLSPEHSPVDILAVVTGQGDGAACLQSALSGGNFMAHTSKAHGSANRLIKAYQTDGGLKLYGSRRGNRLQSVSRIYPGENAVSLGRLDHLVEEPGVPVTVALFLWNGTNFDWIESREIAIVFSPHLELDAPQFIESGESYFGALRYFAPEPSLLMLSNRGKTVEYQVNGRGTFEIELLENTELHAALRVSKSEGRKPLELRYASSARVETVQRFFVLRQGTDYTFDSPVTLLEGLSALAADYIARGLLEYPWGCGEQTAAKLASLLTVHHSLRKKGIAVKLLEVEARMTEGLERMSLFKAGDGLFSMWEGGAPSTSITAMIREHLSGYRQVEALPDAVRTLYAGLLQYMKCGDASQPESYASLWGENGHEALSGWVEKLKAGDTEAFTHHGWLQGTAVAFSARSRSAPELLPTLYALSALMTHRITRLELLTDRWIEQVPVREGLFRELMIRFGFTSRRYRQQAHWKSEMCEHLVEGCLEYILSGFRRGLAGSTYVSARLLQTLEWMEGITARYVVDGTLLPFDADGRALSSGRVTVMEGIGIVVQQQCIKIDDSRFQSQALHISTEKALLPQGGFSDGRIAINEKAGANAVIRLYVPAHLRVYGAGLRNCGDHTYEVVVPEGKTKLPFTVAAVGKGKGRLRAELTDMYEPTVALYGMSGEITGIDK